MHEGERHLLILSVLQEKPVVTVHELVDLTKSSEATIRRDIAALHQKNKLHRMRGGAEAKNTRAYPEVTGRSFATNQNR